MASHTDSGTETPVPVAAPATPATAPPCVLCGADIVGHCHNAEPMARGKCCDACNSRVLAVRVRGHGGSSAHGPAFREVQVWGPAKDAPELGDKFCAVCQTHTNKGMLFPCCSGFVCWEEGNPDRQCALNFRMSFGKKTKIVLHEDGTLEQLNPPTCPYCRAVLPSSNMAEKITAMLRKKAERGDPLHQFALAKYLLTKVNTPETLPEAHFWMEKSIAQNFPGAMHMKAQRLVEQWRANNEDSLVREAIDLLARCVGKPLMTTEMLVQPLCLFTRELYVTADVLPRNMSHAHTLPLWLRVAKACQKKMIPVGCANCDSKYVLNIMGNGTPGVDKIGNPRKPGTGNWCPCMAVRYCSRACQKEHWPAHKKCHKHYLE